MKHYPTVSRNGALAGLERSNGFFRQRQTGSFSLIGNFRHEMRSRNLILRAGAVAAWCAVSQAAATPLDPTAGLIDRPDVADMRVLGAKVSGLVAAPDLPGASAERIEVPAPAVGSHPWDVGVSVLTLADIHKGDPVAAVFWARSETTSGKIGARLQSNDAPYDGIAYGNFDLDANWRLYTVQGIAAQDFAAGRSGLSLSLNSEAQIVDIGPAYIFRTALDTGGLINRLRAIPLGRAVDAMIATPSGAKLAATLRLPAGPGPFPAVMTITGSGPWGRNSNDPLSLAMLDHGIAVLQYDKRGVGQSTGDFATASQADLTDDAAAVAAWLRAQPGIAPQRTGALGGSQGGLIATLVAARDPKVSFVVSMAGPAVPMSELMLEQQEMAGADQGATADQIATAHKMLQTYVAAVQSATSDADAVARVKAGLAPYVEKVITQAVADATAEHVRDPQARKALLYDPKVDLDKIRVPVLGLFATKDHLVAAETNAEALRRDLAGDADVTVVILPGFNHVFQHAKTGSFAEMQQLTEPSGSDPALQKLIIDWIKAHTQ